MSSYQHAKSIAAAAALLVLSGCASGPSPTTDEPRTYCMQPSQRKTICTAQPVPSAAVEADAKRFSPHTGALTLYVVRANWADSIRLLSFRVDRQEPIATLPRSFARLRLEPGAHTLAFEWDGRTHRQTIFGRSGDVLFIKLAASSLPWDGSIHWSLADPVGSRERAAKSRLVADR